MRARSRPQVEAYAADNSPEAALNLGGSMLFMRAAFDAFKRLVRAGEEVDCHLALGGERGEGGERGRGKERNGGNGGKRVGPTATPNWREWRGEGWKKREEVRGRQPPPPGTPLATLHCRHAEARPSKPLLPASPPPHPTPPPCRWRHRDPALGGGQARQRGLAGRCRGGGGGGGRGRGGRWGEGGGRRAADSGRGGADPQAQASGGWGWLGEGGEGKEGEAGRLFVFK
jgi:kinesin family protein 6/9